MASDMEDDLLLPVTDTVRQRRRDAKLDIREEMLADRRRDSRRTCPCNLCLGENHSTRPRSMVQTHLSLYGRHPYHRRSTLVIPLLIYRPFPIFGGMYKVYTLLSISATES